MTLNLNTIFNADKLTMLIDSIQTVTGKIGQFKIKLIFFPQDNVITPAVSK